jgi:uncharacterized protein (DUF1330 family)
MNYLNPTREAFDSFKSLPRDTPINMLNLLRYHEMAEYPEGHPLAGNGWTGRQAYAEYGKTSGPIFQRVGGAIVWRGKWEAMVTGPDDKHWEDAFVAAYPNAGCFLEMITDPEYQKAVVNRGAAILDSRLIRFAPGEGGDGFG